MSKSALAVVPAPAPRRTRVVRPARRRSRRIRVTLGELVGAAYDVLGPTASAGEVHAILAHLARTGALSRRAST